MRTKIRQLLLASDRTTIIGQEHTIKGWVKTVRSQKNMTFIEVNDGSCFPNIQVVVTLGGSLDGVVATITTGSSVVVCGVIAANPGDAQAIELQANTISMLGGADLEAYPLQKKRHSFEFLRSIAHLRARTNTFGAVARVRNSVAFATHSFFQQRQFLYVHTPIIASSDCEGAGELFRVTTLPLDNVPKTDAGNVDFSKDYFNMPTFLTVSGQLNGEAYACGLSDIYTFGPTFRAENSNTARHLSEFWMIEPEMAFADLADDMDLAESYIKYVVQHVLETCPDDMAFLNQYIEPGLLERLQAVIDQGFERTTYTYAIRILQKSGKNFAFTPEWGADLQTEHERYLSEEFFKKPVFITEYPRKIKAFYMRDNVDGKTVAAMDLLVPKIGEIIGGSQREERHDVLLAKMAEFGLSVKEYWWYLELRKYGTVPHSGFGVGFERLIRFITGLENIRDVIAFPRFPGSALF